ncbi:MAG: dienelactone hydrolase family protein [bacterium]|nr:dienelactone hydrolase family protein [bacterium]
MSYVPFGIPRCSGQENAHAPVLTRRPGSTPWPRHRPTLADGEGLEKDPFTIGVGERYAAAGYVCAIPFLFHWWPEDEDVAVKREGFRDDWTVADLTAAHACLAGMESVDADHIGIVGHCWGGRVAWLGACSNVGFQASIICYGGRVKVAFADGGTPPIDLARQINCPVMGVFGNYAQGPSPEDVDDYEAALNEAGVPNEFHRYDGAGHGFQDAGKPERYRHEPSEDAWTRQIAFLDRTLK